MVKKSDSTSAAEESSEAEEVSVDEETVDAGSSEVAEGESLTLDVSPVANGLYHRRAEERGEAPEPAAMLTDDRLIETSGRYREVPEGFWQRFLYEISFHLINVGDSRAVRERKAMDRRISHPFDQGTRFVPVLTRKGGVGKTTVTTLLGMALA